MARPRLRFVFGVSVATRDRTMLEALRAFLGFGSISDAPPGRPGHAPLSEFRVASFRAHHAATIPFAEAFLLRCAKRVQFEEWRDRLRRYEAEHPSRYGKGTLALLDTRMREARARSHAVPEPLLPCNRVLTIEPRSSRASSPPKARSTRPVIRRGSASP